jgi:Rod binding domain-containing protein
MDAVNPILDRTLGPLEPLKPTAPILSQEQADGLDEVRAAAESQRRVRLAKEFESILMTRLLDEMKNTVGNWDEDEDATSQQMQGIFWLHMAQHVGENGGIGLWKDILQAVNQDDPSTLIDPALDDRL